MVSQSASAEDRLLGLLNRLRKLGPGLPPFEAVQITPSQLLLLDWIANSPGCSIQEIASGLRVTPPTVSVAVRRLEKAGLLKRQPDPRDGRAVQIFLTAQGEKLYRKVQDFRRRKARRLIAGLTPQEQKTLLDLLEKAISTAEKEQICKKRRKVQRR